MKIKVNLISSVVLVIFLSYKIKSIAQVRDMYADNWNFVLFQHGNFKESIEENVSKDFHKMKHATLEMNVISDMFYINASAGTSLVLFLDEMLRGKKHYARNNPLIEFGWGFNMNEDHPFKIAPSTDLILGVGFNLGGITLESNRLEEFSTLSKLNFSGGFIGPTIGANIQIADRVNVQNVMELSLAGNGISKGTRFELNSNINFFLSKRIALSLIPTFQKYNLNENDNGVEFRKKILNKFMQYGITFKFG